MLDTLDPIRKLGEGGEGTVWLAWDRTLSRWLAVKIVQLAPGARAVGEALIASLGPAARELLDPAVVPVVASGLLEKPDERFGVTDGLALFIVMPYLHGLPASELGRGPLSTRTVAALFAQGVRLLARLHAQGSAHLDLKPSNLFVEKAGRAWLLDMQLSTVHGSSGFSAPEATPGPAADWYALGRTLAALWTGRTPRGTTDPLPELPKPAVSLSGPQRLAHERLADLIDELTRDDPARRPVASAEEADALARDLGAPDSRQELAAAVASSPFRPKLAEIEQAQAQRADGPKPTAVPIAERVHPVVRGSAFGVGGALVMAMVIAIAVRVGSRPQPLALPVEKLLASATPAAVGDSSPFDASVHHTEEIRVLGPDEKCDPHNAYDRIDAKEPVMAIELWRSDHTVLWHQAHPTGIYRLELRPGHYVWVQLRYDPGDPDNPLPDMTEFHVRAGQPIRFETSYKPTSAPLKDPVPVSVAPDSDAGS